MCPRTSEQFEEIRTESRQAILDAALHVFAEDGYHLASVSKISKKAGVSKGLMYNYFKSKEDLLITLIFSIVEQFEEMFQMKEDEELTRARFIKFIENSIDIVMKDPQHWKLYFAIFIQPDVLPVIMEKMMAKAEPFMKAFAAYFARKGHDDPVAVMRYFSAVVDGVQMHCMLDPENFPAEKVKKMIIEQFV